MTSAMSAAKKTSILFLQGPPSLFWCEMAKAFEAQGMSTHRVNFSLGDQLYWRKRGAINYRRSIKHWPAYVEALIRKNKITDILYYADQLPYHRIACEVARKLGVRCHAVEHGYLRPDWITLERDGMGRFSHFPTDPQHIASLAEQVSEPDMVVKYPHTFGQEAFNEVLYNLVAYFGRPFFPFFDDDKYYSAVVDYLPWVARAFRTPKILETEDLKHTKSAFFLLALQLQSDYQIRANSPYRHLGDMLEEVISSFAAHAEKEHVLLIKQHPLDNGIERWDQRISRIAKANGVEDRVKFIEQGNLNAILAHAHGVIVVNSTVGLYSLRAHKPTLVLGCAVYDIEGLTHNSGLDRFWRSPMPVDAELADKLVSTLAATIQVKGNFYHKEGKKVAIAEIVRRIAQGMVNEPGAFVEPAPRLSSKKGFIYEQPEVRPMQESDAGVL